MIAEVKLPSGHLGAFPVVKIDTELSGEHHEMFLSSPDKMFERTVASVIGSLLQVGDVYRITLADLMYLFYLVRTASVGPAYKAKWICKRSVTPKGNVSQECGCENQYTLSLPANKTTYVPASFAYALYDVTVNSITTRMYVRFLTVAEEFAVLDDLAGHNLSKDMLGDKVNAYTYAKLRLLKAITFEDARVNGYTSEQREDILKALPFSLTQKLFDDMSKLDQFGPDMSPKVVTCTKCKGESKLVIPFSSSFLLS